MPKDSQFTTTRWSIILQAQSHGDGPSAENARNRALAILCETYWFPIYAFVRRSGKGPVDAEDTTQELFLHLIDKNGLSLATKERGRFRSFLLAVVKNLMAGEYRKQTTLKRGGDQRLESLEDLRNRGEELLDSEPWHDLSPDKLFERRWAQSLFDRAVERTKEIWQGAGRDFDGLKTFLTGDKGDESYEEAANRLGISVTAAKGRVHRLRLRFREIFKEEVLHTLEDPSDFDSELQYIQRALQK